MADKSGNPKQTKRSAGGETKSRTRTVEKERLTKAAKQFKMLGDPTRLEIVEFLKERWDQEQSEDQEPEKDGKSHGGARVTEICQKVSGAAKISSTFSHHIKELRRAGLIRVERDCKNRWCQIDAEVLASLHPFLSLPTPSKTPAILTGSVIGTNGTEGVSEIRAL